MSDKKVEQKDEVKPWAPTDEIKTFFRKYESLVDEINEAQNTVITITEKFDKIDEVTSPLDLSLMVFTIHAKQEAIDRENENIEKLLDKKAKMDEEIEQIYLAPAIETLLRDMGYDDDDGTEDDTIKDDKKDDPNKKA